MSNDFHAERAAAGLPPAEDANLCPNHPAVAIAPGGVCLQCETSKPNLYVREGDQALPVPNDEMSCQQRFMDRVNKMAPARMELGLARYGTLLQPFNGRDFAQDVFEEAFDLWAYLEGLVAERDAMMALLKQFADWPQVPSRAVPEAAELVLKAQALIESMTPKPKEPAQVVPATPTYVAHIDHVAFSLTEEQAEALGLNIEDLELEA